MELTERDLDILGALRRVRFFSEAQIARTWWPGAADAVSAARKRLATLRDAGLLHSLPLQVRGELPLNVPLATWQPGLAPPSWPELTKVTKSRFASSSTIRMMAILASGNKPPKETEASHDLHLAAVYLRMRQELPTRARSWLFESEVRPWAGYHPDATVRDGRCITIIEFAGEYDADELLRCHVACEERRCGYEIW